MRNSHVWKLVAALAIAVLTTTASCTNGRNQTGADGASQASPSDISDTGANAKLASSFTERINALLELDDQSDEADRMTQQQRAMLERALDHDGIVSKADYEQAWENYKQCLVDKGYTKPELPRYTNGLYSPIKSTDSSTLTEEENNKLMADMHACSNHYVAVDEMYRYSIANPDMLSNNEEAAVDCLHRKKATEPSYTVSEYRQDNASYETYLSQHSDDPDRYEQARKQYRLDLGNGDVITCLVANANQMYTDDANPWKPFG